MPVVSYQNLSLADKETAWDSGAVRKALHSWADGDIKKYQRAFVWHDGSGNESGCKLPIATLSGNKLVAVPRAIHSAAAAVQGARKGVQIPEAEMGGVKSHIAKYYKKMGETPPWIQKKQSIDRVEAELQLIQHLINDIREEDIDDDYDLDSQNNADPDLARFGVGIDNCIQIDCEEIVKSVVDDETGDLIIEGYMCTQKRTRRGERVKNFCFNESISDYMLNPMMLYNHDFDRPVGNVIETRQDDVGTWVKCRIIDKGEVRQMIESGLVRAFSWMGYVREWHIEPDVEPQFNGAETLWVDKADLIDVSVVTIGNIPNALFALSKSEDGESCDLNIWTPFVENSINDEQRMVFGHATIFNVVDYDGHRMTRKAVEDALPGYAEFRNVREQHSNKAVGTTPVLKVDDIGLYVGAYISEGAQDAWEKIKDGTYKGFSIKGCGKLEEVTIENGIKVKDITNLYLEEISICDRPKCPGTVFQLIKSENGKLIDCQTEGGDIVEKEDKVSLFDKIKNIVTGDSSEEVKPTPDPEYATKDEVVELKASVESLSSKVEELIAKVPEEVDYATIVKDTIVEVVKPLVDRVEALENLGGTRKSSDADGDGDKKDLWEGIFPTIR